MRGGEEILISGQNFANYWLHNAFVRVDKEKMSKSLGNFFSLRDIFKKFEPMVVRLYFLKHWYRAPIDFSIKNLSSVETSYKRLRSYFIGAEENKDLNIENIESDVVCKMLDFLCDDLNVSGALGVLFDSLDVIKKDAKVRNEVFGFVRQVLGLTLEQKIEKKAKLTPEIEQLISKRKQARVEKNWEQADRIRRKLISMGLQINDDKKS